MLSSRSYPPPHSSGSEVLPGVFCELSRGFYGVGEVNGTGEILGCLSLTPLLPALGSPFEE